MMRERQEQEIDCEHVAGRHGHLLVHTSTSLGVERVACLRCGSVVVSRPWSLGRRTEGLRFIRTPTSAAG